MATRVVNLKMDQYDIYIGRGGKWGNPFVIGPMMGRDEAIEEFRKYAIAKGLDKEARALRGKILGCFCKPQNCHGDLLAKWADEEES